jgi:hypothetical protein
MLKWILSKFGRNRVVAENVLTEPPNMGSTRNWSGPEIPLESEYSPISWSICGLLSKAKDKQATKVKLELLESEDNISLEYISDQACEKTPPFPGYLWSSFVTSFPKFSSIELCQGIIIDPKTNEKWRFEYSKENSQILLSMIEGN